MRRTLPVEEPFSFSSSSSISDPPGPLFFDPFPSGSLTLDVLSLRSCFFAPGPARSLLVLFPLLRLRDLMTSVLSEIGLGRPFILKNRAQALQRMWVLSWDRRQSGVVYRNNVSKQQKVSTFFAGKPSDAATGDDTDLSRAVGAYWLILQFRMSQCQAHCIFRECRTLL